MASVVLTFSNITNNGKPCKDPIIYITGSDNVAFPCGDKVDENGQIKLTVPDSLFGERQCITGVIKCAECDSCKEEEFNICLCDESNPCEICQECKNGVCVEKCPDKKCVDGTCCDCETASDCGNGYICNGCSCVCPTGYKNSNGDCVECLTNQQCGPCEECKDGRCVSKCAEGLICGGNGDCECPPGTKYNIDTKKCEQIECSRDADCAACETCIGGQCVPIVCPDGYKCVDGECVKWPCKDTKCENGADCGDGCGCLNGECVPCYLLDCADEAASCQGALGCQCNGEKCEPVDNCKQYCDGSTPCLDTNCTCYNNECVSCKNFPCDPDQCSDKYNCACNNGNCEGGGGDGGCRDSLKLTKESVCNDNGCALLATFTAEKGCKCDPIEFRVKHVQDSTVGGDTSLSDSILNLAVAMYKNNKAYVNFRNEITMGDDELVSATIQTVITHRVNGSIVTPPVTAVATSIVDGSNKIANIKIGNTNIAKTFNQSGTKVTVQLRAVGLKVPNNGCTQYEDSVIAEFELDYTSTAATQLTQNRINGEYSSDNSIKVNDNASSRVPLFIWSKSSSSSFSNSKFNNASGVYAQSGWFRKEYGQFANGSWTDRINNPAKQTAGGQTNELWNNFNYRVTVDCGCKQNSDTLQNLVFCCTDKVIPILSNCNRTLNIDKFSVCSVNSYLGASTSTYNIPKEAQTYFWVVVNNGEYEKKLRTEGGNLTAPMTPYTHSKPIENLRIEQRYEGNPLVPVACAEEYKYEGVSPNFELTKECGKIVVKNIAGNPAITGVALKQTPSDILFTPSQTNTVWTLENNIIKKNGTFSVEVAFQGGCIRVEDVVITCEADIEAKADPGEFALEGCGGKNPNIIVTTKQGFTSAVQFAISTAPNQFVSGVLVPTTGQYTYTFTNGGNGYPAGTYTITAKEGSLTKQATVVIKPTKSPVVTVTDICLTTQGNIAITNLVPNSKWSITGPIGNPNFNNSPLTANTNGSINVGIPVGGQGDYNISFVSDPPNSTEKTCPKALVAKVGTGGNVSPKVILLQGGDEVTIGTTVGIQTQACVGESIQFRIDDGGKNLTYNLVVNGISPLPGIITTTKDDINTSITTLKASTQSSPNWAYYKIPEPISTIPSSSTSYSQLSITDAIDKACNTVVATLLKVIVKPTPKIINVINRCVTGQQDPYLYNIDVITNYQPSDNVIVKVQGLSGNTQAPVTLVYNGTTSPGQYKYSTDATPNPPGPVQGPQIKIEAYFQGGCAITDTRNLPPCTQGQACPPPESVDILIQATPQSPTCSNNENVQLAFQYATGLGDLNGKEYTWYVGSGSNYIPAAIIGYPNPGVIDPLNPIPVLPTVAQPSTENYKLTISSGGECVYESNIVQVYSIGTPISADIFGPGAQGDTTPVLTNTTYNYYVTAVPNATYVWTLSNSNGSGQSIGSNSNTIQVSNFIEGPNTIGVTITTANGCSESGTATINVGANCSGFAPPNLQLTSSTNPTCSNVIASLSPIPSGYTITLYEWKVSYDGGATYTTVQSGTSGPVSTFDTTAIPAGTVNAKIKLSVTIGGIGSCPTVESTPLNYTRCNCLCNSSNICGPSFVPVSGGNAGYSKILGTFDSGSTFNWYFNPKYVADRLQILVNGSPVLDTNVVSGDSSCHCSTRAGAAACSCADLFLGDTGVAGSSTPPFDLTTIGGIGTAEINPGVGACSTNSSISQVAEVLTSSFGVPYAMKGSFSLTLDAEVEVVILGQQCNFGGSSWDFGIECV